MQVAEILEDRPRRESDPNVEAWIVRAMQRPDAASLYIHGSNQSFDRFRPPTTHAHLIFGSKLIEQFRHGKILQAEYYGSILYLVKFHFKKLFLPYSDPVAKQIMAEAFAATEVWDAAAKLKQGRLDYQDLHLVVPPAIKAGYDAFRVFEVSIMGDSYGVTRPELVEIIDRYPKLAKR